MDKKVYEFISKQSGNPILEWRTCKWTGEEFPIFQLQRDIENSLDMTYQQDLSPSAIFRAICMFRNERHLYRNISKLSDKPIITMYAPESGVNVYDTPEFWASDFILPGKDIPTDLDEITSAFTALVAQVPKQGRINDRNENAEYANYVGSSKNIYMSFLAYYESEDVYYSYYTIPGKDIVDCFYIKNSSLCYESINIFDSYGIFFCYTINNSQNCYFSTDLDNCHHCLFCSNLRGKAYYIHNKEYTKEEFETYFTQMKEHMKTYSGLQKYIIDYENVLTSALYRNVNQVNSENCTGDGLVNSHQSILSFDSWEADESVNVRGGPFEKCLNMIGGYSNHVANSGRVGAGVVGEYSGKIMGSYNAYTSYSIINCQDLIGCNNMLFCCGLKNKEYCILNRQFSKQEREKISKDIIDQMKQTGIYGKYPDLRLSSFPYNDTIANDLFPVKAVTGSKLQGAGDTLIVNEQGEGTVTILEPDEFISDAILDLGGEEKIKIKRRTRETEINIPENAKKLLASELPENIDDVKDEILEKIIICEASGRPFRIMGPELTFYRKHGLPLPHKHHDVRHQMRRDKRPMRNLHLRNCDKCAIEMLSVYSPEVKHKVYCEQCYDKEVYG